MNNLLAFAYNDLKDYNSSLKITIKIFLLYLGGGGTRDINWNEIFASSGIFA